MKSLSINLFSTDIIYRMSDQMKGRDSIPVRKFDLKKMVPAPSIVMIAKRGSGKSWICRSILKQLNTIPVGAIISPTDKMSCFYGEFFPNTFIHYQFSSDLIHKILARQDNMIEKRKLYKIKGKFVDTRSILIMDDCLASKGTWMKDETVGDLLFNGRHYHITYILTMQFPLGISPELRSNFDYVFLMADNFQSNIKRMYDHYAGMFPTFDAFKQVFTKLTTDHGAMVIVNRLPKGEDAVIFNQVQYYKAPNINNKDVKIGCTQFRKFHELNYNKHWRDKKQQFDFNNFAAQKKKSKTAINIEKLDEYEDEDNERSASRR